MNDDQSCLGGVTKAQQRLAERGHGARVIFVLVVGGIQRIQDDDFRFGGLGRGQEVIESLGCVQEMARGTSIDEQVLIRRLTQRLTHLSQARGKLLGGKLKLANQHTTRHGNLEAGARRSRGQRQGEIGDENRFANLGFAATKQNPLKREQGRFHEAWLGRGTGAEKVSKRDDSRKFVAHSRASGVASSMAASSTTLLFRDAARRNAASARLLTLRIMPFVA